RVYHHLLALHFQCRPSLRRSPLPLFPTRRSPDLGFQLLKSPTTLTAVAWGAHRRNMTPFSPPCSVRWEPKKRWASKLLPCLYRRSEEDTAELQSRFDLVCRLLLEKHNLVQQVNAA